MIAQEVTAVEPGLVHHIVRLAGNSIFGRTNARQSRLLFLYFCYTEIHYLRSVLVMSWLVRQSGASSRAMAVAGRYTRTRRSLMARSIDIPTHAFPDPVAKIVIPALGREGGIAACLDVSMR